MGEFTQFSWIDLLYGRVIYNTHGTLYFQFQAFHSWVWFKHEETFTVWALFEKYGCH
jgi:hypothetical protein